MAQLGAPTGERFVRLPAENEVCEDSGLTGFELRKLIYPCVENGNNPVISHHKIEFSGEDDVIVIPWRQIHQYIMKLDVKRSYKLPRAFYKWIVRFSSCHRSQIPDNVVQVTSIFLKGEEPQFQTAIDEQLSMNREVWVVYTRKGALVAYERRR